AHRLHQFIDGLIIVPPRVIVGDDGVFVENLTYVLYEHQDSILSTWLISTISSLPHNQLIGSSSSAYELWEALTRIFGTQSTTKAMRYRSLLHHFKKNELFMPVYLARIKHLCDCLVDCGQHVSLEDHQLVILNGLPLEFDYVVSIITMSRVPFDLHL
ncbi:hypothetical protein Goklo_024476, partial [Gossypium klotzschianum]|nr:hypothetical protein [Gossypium klotzschianum]